jgi:hypothetical protein
MDNLGPVHILTSSSRGREIDGPLNNLTLRCRESLTSRLRSLLRLRLSRMEHMSNYRGSSMGSRGTPWLMLIHQLMFALHHTSMIL